MTTKSILLAVADPQILIDTTQALDADWEATCVASEPDALAQFEERSFDAVLVDFNLSSPDASELLNQVSEKHPETIRFLLAHESDLALVAAKVNGTPNILPKPIEPASLRIRIDNGVKDLNSEEIESERANISCEPPKIPAIYSEVLKAVESAGVTSEQIGEIIAQDTALTSEVLRITNSSYLGLPHNFTRPVEAVESLGLDGVKALVMALQFLAENSGLKLGYLSLDQIWQHSVTVGQIARDLMLHETKDRTLASQALAAGLVHDLGKVVLAKNFEDLYGRVQSLARKQPVPLWEIEKEMFGANHGEIGGCLVGMWNMPSAIVEATALHHEPPLGEDQGLTPLAAVHIANVLELEVGPSDETIMVAPVISAPFLNQLGLLQRLPVWRAALTNRRSVGVESEIEPAEADQPRWAVRSSTSGRLRSGTEIPSVHPRRSRIGFVWAGSAAILVLLALSFRTQRELNQLKQVYARTAAPYEARGTVSSTPLLQAAPVAAKETKPTVDISEETPAAPTLSESISKPAASPAEPEHRATIAATATPATLQSTNAAPEKGAQPDFRLTGIFFTSVRPSAIVNGRTVNIGDEVDGANVVGIERNGVTLEMNGQRKTYKLR